MKVVEDIRVVIGSYFMKGERMVKVLMVYFEVKNLKMSVEDRMKSLM